MDRLRIMKPIVKPIVREAISAKSGDPAMGRTVKCPRHGPYTMNGQCPKCARERETGKVPPQTPLGAKTIELEQ